MPPCGAFVITYLGMEERQTMITIGKKLQSNTPQTRCALLLICLSFLILNGCGRRHKIVSIRAEQYKVYSYQNSGNRAKVSLLKKHFSRWQGTKYRNGGMSHSGIDCSGFSVVTYRDLFGIKLPRTTTKQAERGRAVSKSGLRAGDLVFFKTGRWQKHVGIYMEKGRFIHASTSRGVMVSNLKDRYWRKSYWKARRL